MQHSTIQVHSRKIWSLAVYRDVIYTAHVVKIAYQCMYNYLCQTRMDTLSKTCSGKLVQKSNLVSRHSHLCTNDKVRFYESDGCRAIDLKQRKFPWVTDATDLSHPSHGYLVGLIHSRVCSHPSHGCLVGLIHSRVCPCHLTSPELHFNNRLCPY